MSCPNCGMPLLEKWADGQKSYLCRTVVSLDGKQEKTDACCEIARIKIENGLKDVRIRELEKENRKPLKRLTDLREENCSLTNCLYNISSRLSEAQKIANYALNIGKTPAQSDFCKDSQITLLKKENEELKQQVVSLENEMAFNDLARNSRE